MIALDDFPAEAPVVTRFLEVTDGWRRWLMRLQLLMRISVVTLGNVSRRVTAPVAPTWLRSSEDLPAGLYRVTVSGRTLAGSGTIEVSVLTDEAGIIETPAAVLVATAGTTTGVVLRRLAKGARIGYQVAATGTLSADVELVVEALPASTRLG